MLSNKLVIFGSAEIASLAKYYFSADDFLDVVGFTVDDEFVTEDFFEGLPVVPFSEIPNRYPNSDYQMHVALSYQKLNTLRQEKYIQAKNAGYSLASYIHGHSAKWANLKTGDNCFVLENQTIQPGVSFGDNVMVWSGNHIGHGSLIGNHTYISSHVVISGNCVFGERNFIGVNACFKDFTKVGDDCFIGMGACVTNDIATGSVVVSKSSEVFGADDRRSVVLKRRYFGI